MITVELDGERIRLTGGYTPGLSRQIPGARFSKVGGPHWMLPLTMTTCRKAREVFGASLRVGADLAEWARGAIEREQYMESLGKAHDAELSHLPQVSPVLAQAMSSRTYQRVGVRYAVEARSALLAAEPGLGKTLMAIGAVIESGVSGPYLVVCPKTAVESVWTHEIPRWWPQAQALSVPDGRAVRDEILDQLLEEQEVAQYLRQDGSATVEQAPLWLVVHPEMARCKRWWVCPKCGGETPWRAGKKTLECVTNFEHEQPNPKDVKVRVDPTFPQLFQVEWGAIIMDESDRMLIRKSASQTQTRNGAEDLRACIRPDGLAIAMSGTPFRGKPYQLWGTLNWLRPKVYSSQWRWMESYWKISSTWGGGREVGDIIPEREADLYRDLNQIMLRQTKAEVAKDMPPKTYVGTPLVTAEQQAAMARSNVRADMQVDYGAIGSGKVSKGPSAHVHERDIVGVWLPMDPAQARVYRQMEAEGMASLEGGEVNTIGVLAEMTRLKQFATACGRVVGTEFQPTLPSNKFNHLVQMLEEMGYPDDPQDKVVVVSQFTQVLDLFDAELRKLWAPKGTEQWAQFGSCMLTGRVTGRARADAINRFNQDVGTSTEHVMFLNVKAGGVAITLDSADHMVLLDETWVVDDQTQVEDRIHRVSRPRPVFYHYLRSLGTIEEHIAAANAEWAAASHQVLDGRRGVEVAKKVLQKMGVG